MKPRSTALLALVVAALAAFVYFYEIRGAEERAEAEAAGKRVFPGLEAAEIDSLVLRTSDAGTVRLERADGGWQLVEPLVFPADAPGVEGIASALAQLESVAVYDDPAPLEDYGLEGEPAIRFTVGGVEHALHVGARSPLGGNSYVATGDDGAVHAVATYRTTSLSKSMDDLRDKRILSFDRGSVEELRAAWPGGAVRLVRDGEGWRMLEPLEAEADVAAVQDLLSDLSYLRASGFVDAAPDDPAVSGLAAPEFEIELRTAASEEGGEPGVVSLVVGATSDGAQRLVRGRVAGTLYTIPQETLDDFPRRVSAYRVRALAGFAPSAAERFELVFHDEAEAQSTVVSGVRQEEGWSTSPDPLDPGRASTLVSELSRLEATDIAAESMGEAELAGLGLAPPRVQILVYGKAPEGEGEAPLLADVRLGAAGPERGIAARRGDRETVYWLDYDLAQDLPVNLEAFRNRFIAPPGAAPAAGLEPAAPAE